MSRQKIKLESSSPELLSPSKKISIKSEAAEEDSLLVSPRKKRMKIRIPPKNWKLLYNGIKAWRLKNVAPVDTMGCDLLAESENPSLFRYQTLVALQLSSQTKDPVTAEAMRNLQSHPRGGLSIDSVLSMSDKELNGYICKVGFHNRKTLCDFFHVESIIPITHSHTEVRYLKQTAAILKERFNSDIPTELKDILSLPGVGPKMAHLLMQCAWKKNSGIGVDTHVHRISHRLGWALSAKTPEQTRLELEDWLPSEHWGEVNHLLVGFGQLLCKPIGPLCHECPVREECPKIGTRSSPSR